MSRFTMQITKLMSLSNSNFKLYETWLCVYSELLSIAHSWHACVRALAKVDMMPVLHMCTFTVQ